MQCPLSPGFDRERGETFLRPFVTDKGRRGAGDVVCWTNLLLRPSFGPDPEGTDQIHVLSNPVMSWIPR